MTDRTGECGCGGACGDGDDRLWRTPEDYLRDGPVEAAAEFPKGVRQPALSRRTALKLLAATSLLPAAACAPPPRDIVPYVNMPERVVPGEPLQFATMVTLSGFAQPVLATSREGRPTKLEPNPAYRGAVGTSVFTQGEVLSLYDPDRSRTLLHEGEIASWSELHRTVVERVQPGIAAARGRGLRILTGRVTSPTLLDQLDTLLDRYPGARWHCWEPVDTANEQEGARLAFGRPLEVRPRFDRARRILSLDADFLGPGPAQTANAAAYADGARARARVREMTRLYCVEPSLTITGATAAHRHAVGRGNVAAVAKAVMDALEGQPIDDALPESLTDFVAAAARDLSGHPGEALIVAGRAQPPEVHALVHAINERLGANGRTVSFVAPDAVAARCRPLAPLVREMRAGEVETLVILDGNPVYDAPADLGFGAALREVPFSLHLGLMRNETARACRWHVPALHALESWGDGRTADGQTALQQPLITPLYGGRSPFALLGMLLDPLADFDDVGRRAVRAHWRQASGAADFEAWWSRNLSRGLVEDGARGTVDPGPARRHQGFQPEFEAGRDGAFEAVFLPHPSMWDGRFANNAWLQETPEPLSKLTWGNAALLAPADAEALGVEDGDVVTVMTEEGGFGLPAMVSVGQAPGSVGLFLGYGRLHAGEIGTEIGTDVYPLRRSDALWARPGLALAKGDGRRPLATTQHHHDMHGRDIVRTLDLDAFAAMEPYESHDHPPSLYPDYDYESHAWGMVIDQTVCIGCNACMVACQAENNVPVVGPDEILRGREMHWLRIDRYYKGEPENAETLFQPVTCMHCEKAPCEPVCPVEASVHDSEGLNVQVYNRCIGTRFCQANCPYKVRRFNFFGYGDDQTYENLGEPVYDAVSNPDVSVRSRGVMEKCTYCVQRISRARRTADVEDRPLGPQEVVTACQAACPTRAIVFGDLNNAESPVRVLKDEPHEYALLGELGTRPRTTYLARVRSVNGEVRRP